MMQIQKLFLLSLVLFTFLSGQNAPLSPTVYATVNHNSILVSWDALAETSIDSLTGYADFEGYRIYRSQDGGETWGSVSDKLYDFDGHFVGYLPYVQFDLDEEHDAAHCIYTADACESNDPKREVSIYGLDPLNPRFSLGIDAGISYAFIDSNVVDGIEYTYTVTAYDMGLQGFSVEYSDEDGDGIFVADTTFPATNPGHILGPDTLVYYDYTGEIIRRVPNPNRGYWSLESPKGQSAEDQNFITIVAGYTASNITFPAADDIDALFSGALDNLGTGDRDYFIVDRRELKRRTLKFEVNASQGEDAVDGMACEYPSLFIYEIDDSVSQTPSTLVSLLLSDYDSLAVDSLLDLPDAESDGTIITHPDYLMVADFDAWSDLLDGIRFKFDHSIPLYPFAAPNAVEILNMDFNLDTLIFEQLEINLSYTNLASYNRRLNFDYLIEFFDEPTADSLNGVGFPFRFTNLYTGKKVGFNFDDFTETFDFELGAFDNTWTRNEAIHFIGDTLLINGDTLSVYTYDLKLGFEINDQIASAIAWDETREYSEEERVFYKNMLWKAVLVTSDEPTPYFVDTDGDGENDNPWRLDYPWQTGDSVIVRPQKFYVDGDHWIANMEILGASHDVADSTLQEIKVVPNPYLVHSRFNETQTDRRLRFTHLPQKCRITIYTITGEVVTTIDHESEYDGNAWWDLRTSNGDVVGPGLYIYFVETENGFTHIDKFAVVR